MSISFMWQSKQVTLYGLRSRGDSTQGTGDDLLKGATLFSVITYSPLLVDGCLWQSQLDVTTMQGSEMSMEQQSQLQKVLQSFPEVFNERLGLPPKQDIEHSIILQEGTPPVNVRPYHYPHYQKNEKERQVQEMITQGIIRPSSSPFSSPVILVKKKDDTWRMCRLSCVE